MINKRCMLAGLTVGVVTSGYLALAQQPAQPAAPPPPMSFFITSAGPGNGANLGGVAGGFHRRGTCCR